MENPTKMEYGGTSILGNSYINMVITSASWSLDFSQPTELSNGGTTL